MFNIATFRFFLLSSILIAFLFPNYSVAKCPTRMGSVYPQDFFLVIAHRGSTIKFPENTIPAFKESLNTDGANSLAVDLSLTKDKKIVLSTHYLPSGVKINLEDEQLIDAGEILAKIPKAVSKTSDITK